MKRGERSRRGSLCGPHRYKETFERQVLGMIRVHTQIGEEQLLSARVVAYRTR